MTYVFSELGNGIRRNLSMTIAVITTIFVSLTLVALGFLLNQQANKAEDYWGDRLQITAFMCTPVSPQASCIDGAATEAQKAEVEEVLESNPRSRIGASKPVSRPTTSSAACTTARAVRPSRQCSTRCRLPTSPSRTG